MDDTFETTMSLVHAAQEGDRGALEDLFTRYVPRVRQIVALRLGYRLNDFADGEDLVQEALLDIFQNLDRFEETNECTFRNWLAVCVANSVRQHFRKAGAKKRGGGKVLRVGNFGTDDLGTVVFAGTGPSPSAIVRGRELAENVEEALLSMKEHHREVIVLRRVCGMTFADVARTMGFGKESTARKVFSRAIERLKEILGEITLAIRPRKK